MFTEQSISKLIRTFAAAHGFSDSYAARLVAGSGDTLDRLDAGMGMGLRRANRIVQNIADRWGVDDDLWPDDIPRPARTPPKTAEAS